MQSHRSAPIRWMTSRSALAGISLFGVLMAGCTTTGPARTSPPSSAGLTIVHPPQAAPSEVFAAREVQRYVYLRTGTLAPIVTARPGGPPPGDLVVLGSEQTALHRDATKDPATGCANGGCYRLTTVRQQGRQVTMITGADPVGTLYGAYRLAEHLGVRFYLHGDVIPDAKTTLPLPKIEEVGQPIFAQRGIQPFHDFPEGPDWWSLEGYRAIIGQLAKLRMNFIGFHTYPEGGVGPEPMVWIGQPEDVAPDGSVTHSYPSRHFSTVSGTWGYQARKTSAYDFGADQLFEHDEYCQDVQVGLTPWPETPDESNQMFNAFGKKLSVAFADAKARGIRTCVGTEVPLTIPSAIRDRVLSPEDGPIRTLGGKNAQYAEPIADTDEDEVYQSVRWGLDGYRFNLPNGEYQVTLKFAELAYGTDGRRVFSVQVQGRPAAEHLDIHARVGKNRALDLRREGIEVTDGTLAVDFAKEVEFPCIAGIVIENADNQPVVKLNCGGPAHADYSADMPYRTDPTDIQRMYEGMFTRIMRACPVDYYWFWTNEGWTWTEIPEAQVEQVLQSIELGIAAAKAVAAPFKLATCGWVLGPHYDRALFDRRLPRDLALSCINRMVGHDVVDRGFARIFERPKWVIPWLEDDPAMVSPQLWVGRMRKDAVDARDYRCTGLMGIHWRTRILGPNVAALADAAWTQGDWREAKTRIGGPNGGQPIRFDQVDIAKTDNDPVFRSMREGMTAYGFDVPNGPYKVILQFSEPIYALKGKRVFDVSIQGKKVIEDLDIFAEAGADTALERQFEGNMVDDGWLEITFEAKAGQPCIAGIVLTGTNFYRHINCGGDSFKTYLADPEPYPASPRFAPCDDFYRDWALTQFGPQAADELAALFTRLDGNLPRPSTWVDGPGGIQPDVRPWDEVAPTYAFADEMAALRPKIKGAGNLERFDYWLHQFQYMKANAKINCLWAQYNEAFKKVEAEQDAEKKKQLARESALPIRVELVAAVGEVYHHLLASVTTYGGIGNVTNWQQHILPKLIEEPGQALAEILAEPLPPAAVPDRAFHGTARVFVPEVRTSVAEGTPLTVKIIALGVQEPKSVSLHWRTLGADAYHSEQVEHVARGVWRATIPEEATGRTALAYYVRVVGADDETLYWPATAPTMSQTVVVEPAGMGPGE